MKKIVYFIPSMILMYFIFGFSSQTGTESSSLSHSLMIWIQTHMHITISEFIIRKGAHMSEYALLALSFLFAYYKSGVHLKRVGLYSFISCFAYACTDEFHQLFIGGRAGQFQDVLIDSTGALLMIIFVSLIVKHFHKRST